MENPIKMDDLGVPLFLETPKLLKKHHRIKVWAEKCGTCCVGLFFFGVGILKKSLAPSYIIS